METKKASKILAVALSFAALAVYGCGGGGGGGGGTTPPPSISDNTQGTQAASSSVQAGSMASGSTQTFVSLGNVGLSSIAATAPEFKTPSAFKPDPGMGKAMNLSAKFAKSKAARSAASAAKKAVSMKTPITPGLGTCSGGGSYSYTGTINEPNAGDINFTITFSNCKEEDTQYNGVYNMTGTAASQTFTIGDSTTPFTILEYSSGTLVSRMEAVLTMGFTATMSATGGTFSMTANGTMDVFDYISQEQFAMTFTTFKDDLTFTADAVTGTETIAITTNGGFSESWTGNSVAASFQDFKLAIVITSTEEKVSISGSFTINFTLDNCFEGTFTFVTVTPITTNALGDTIAGEITINGATTIKWNADGTITVTTAGVSKPYNSEFELNEVCDFATFDEQTPASQSGSGGGTVSNPANMTVTMTWDSPNSDMDLHLSYYNTTNPVAGSSPTWHLYFGSGPGGACSSDNAIWTDTNVNGSIDAGETVYALLDIDDCSGYGPEHVTMSSLQSGYYIAFVDPWSMCGASSCDGSSTVNVSIQLGNQIFTFDPHPFTSDLDPDYMVVGITVDSAGNATIAAPRSDLNTGWAPGLRPAAKARR